MQKKFTLFAVFLSFSMISLGQFQKGTVTSNISIGDIRNFSIRNKHFDKRNDITFNPGIGYFIKNNWEVGAGFSYRSVHLIDSAHGTSYENTRMYQLYVYSNYYFGKGKLKPYIGFQAGWTHAEGKGNYYGQNMFSLNSNDLYYGLSAGLNWNINSRFSLFSEASYIRDAPFSRYGHGRSNFTIGARFFFNRKK
jgi:outer membrane protein W